MSAALGGMQESSEIKEQASTFSWEFGVLLSFGVNGVQSCVAVMIIRAEKPNESTFVQASTVRESTSLLEC